MIHDINVWQSMITIFYAQGRSDLIQVEQIIHTCKSSYVSVNSDCGPVHVFSYGSVQDERIRTRSLSISSGQDQWPVTLTQLTLCRTSDLCTFWIAYIPIQGKCSTVQVYEWMFSISSR